MAASDGGVQCHKISGAAVFFARNEFFWLRKSHNLHTYKPERYFAIQLHSTVKRTLAIPPVLPCSAASSFISNYLYTHRPKNGISTTAEEVRYVSP